VHGDAFAHGAGPGGLGDGSLAPAAVRRDPPLGPGLPVHVAGVRQAMPGGRRQAVGRLGRRLLRQRHGREFLRNAGVRVPGSATIQDPEGGPDGRPQGRHAVNQFASIQKSQVNPLCTFHRVGWQSPFERRIRVPDVIFFEFEPAGVRQVVFH